MSDLEQSKALYDKLEVPYKVENVRRVVADKKDVPVLVLTIEAKSGPKVQGYSGFMQEMVFDEYGMFLYMGIWE